MDVFITYDKLDPECVDLVKFFNSIGLKTMMSCQGHDSTSQSLFYITFDPSVTCNDIIEFQRKYLDSRGNFCSCGHFGKRLFVYSDFTLSDEEGKCVYECWEYVAAGIDAAHADFDRWTRF